MRVSRLLFAALLAVAVLSLAVACQKRGEAPPPASSAARESLDAAAASSTLAVAARRGQQEFLAYCAMCHGNDGNADGEAAQRVSKAGYRVAKLTDAARLQALGRNGVREVIVRGGAHTGRSNMMPSWGDRLSSGTVDAITDYVMTLPARNPGLPDEDLKRYLAAPPGVAADGRELFVHNCTVCHGPFGKGDGPLGLTLAKERNIRPRDLTDSTYMATLDDQRIYTVIMLGGGHVHRSAYMPVWAVTLEPAQVKSLVSYIRAISHTAAKP
jgi:mono/diheme cytochrome c family protein